MTDPKPRLIPLSRNRNLLVTTDYSETHHEDGTLDDLDVTASIQFVTENSTATFDFSQFLWAQAKEMDRKACADETAEQFQDVLDDIDSLVWALATLRQHIVASQAKCEGHGLSTPA